MDKFPTEPWEDGLSADRQTAHFAYPGDERDIMRAWENFLSGVPAVGPTVRVIVENSWKRSSVSGVDAHGTGTPVVMGEDAIDQLRERHRLLSAAAGPTLAENAELLKGTRSMLILTDPTGVVLDVAGDQGTIDSGQDINLVIGGSWNERVVGTNAIGTAMALGQAVQVHATEHFCEGVKKWTCAAAPIHDPRDRTLLGVFDISGPDMSFCQHNLALALVAAKQIEATLVEQTLVERSRLLEACLSVRPRGGEGLVVLDRSGRVVYVNDKAVGQMRRGSIRSALKVGERFAEPGTTSTPEQLVDRLPAELRPEWLHPLTAGDETLGTLLVIPGQPQPRTPMISNAQHEKQATSGDFAAIVGSSEVTESTVARARRVAKGSMPVLIEGETGVGKELFAAAIHAAGATVRGPLVTCNCGAISKDLIGSELFGYVKGAFTGASHEGRVGRFELADGGTLCLDEIGEMPLDLQPYLLRVLDEGIVYRLGENRPRKVKVRLLALTNRNLRAEVAAGRFRQDLFYRITVTTLVVPPLRERRDDINTLIDHFNTEMAKHHRLAPSRFSSEVLGVLRRYDWPGNVRELKNVIESLLLIEGDKPITVADLPAEILEQVSDAERDTAASLKGLEATECQAIEAAVRASRGNVTRAAKELGISRSTLYRKIELYGVATELASVKRPRHSS